MGGVKGMKGGGTVRSRYIIVHWWDAHVGSRCRTLGHVSITFSLSRRRIGLETTITTIILKAPLFLHARMFACLVGLGKQRNGHISIHNTRVYSHHHASIAIAVVGGIFVKHIAAFLACLRK